ncbi:unnamed protein product [Dicrocoelium dendriticum]|nr:unnamed protein product [Dicrocoelium dendriticum]
MVVRKLECNVRRVHCALNMSGPRSVKLRKSKVENEVEKCRSEECWSKALELLLPHKNDSGLAYLYSLVMCENILEVFEHAYISDEEIERAGIFLLEALKTPDDQYLLEANILRGKLLYIGRGFAESLTLLQKLNLPSIRAENYSSRHIRLVSEGLAIIGVCREEFAKMSRRSLSENERLEALSHYDLSLELCCRHFQELYQNNSDLSSAVVSFPKVVFIGIQRLFTLVRQFGTVSDVVAKFRHYLRWVETPSSKALRQWLTCQFAEVLLRGMCIGDYEQYDLVSDRQPATQTLSLPLRYPAGRFVPNSLYSEAILMLLISEHIASQEMILNRPTETSDARFMQSLSNASSVYNLLTIILSKTGRFGLLSKTLEKSLKFSYREFHIWFQFALSLINCRKYYRAYLVLRECLRLNPGKLSIFFLAISLCFGQLGLTDDGIELASRAVEVASKRKDSVMCARAHLMLGWGYSLFARKCRIVDKKNELQVKATAEYKMATELDPDDYLAWYHLAVELSIQRQLEDALAACQSSLRLMPSHAKTLRLLALLHTAGRKRLDQASKVLRVGLADKPNDFSLLFLLAKVEAVRHNPKAGLLVYLRLLEAWRNTFSLEVNTELGERTPTSLVYSTTDGMDETDLGNLFGAMPTFTTEEEIMLPAATFEANPLAAALSSISNEQVGQIGSSIVPVPKPSRSTAASFSPALQMQAKIYHGLAELYLASDQLGEAKDALDEAVKITGLDVNTLYLRGRLIEKDGHLTKARSVYESVIAVQPTHLAAHLSLANLLRKTNQAALAERVVRDAMYIDPTSCQVWHLLAEVLALPGASEPASDGAVTKALFNAVELGQTEPLEPFYQLPIGVQCT